MRGELDERHRRLAAISLLKWGWWNLKGRIVRRLGFRWQGVKQANIERMVFCSPWNQGNGCLGIVATEAEESYSLPLGSSTRRSSLSWEAGSHGLGTSKTKGGHRRNNFLDSWILGSL